MKFLAYTIVIGLAVFFVLAALYAFFEIAMALHEHGLRGIVTQFWCGQVGCKP